MNHAKLDLKEELGGLSSATWKMQVTDFDSRQKLSNTQVQGLLYTLALVFNKNKDGGFGGADYRRAHERGRSAGVRADNAT